jgi:hypothetical protein
LACACADRVVPATANNADIIKHALSRRPLRIRDCFRIAHDPPKSARVGEKIMRSFNGLARDRRQNRVPLLPIALWLDAPLFAGGHLIATNLYGG